MKKILIAAILLSALQSYGQENKLMKRDFWQAKPDLAVVKANLEDFKFSESEKGDDPLSLAIGSDASIDIIKFLAEQPGVNMKKDIHEGRTYLHSAASKGNAEATEVLLKKGSDIYYADTHDQTALTYAGFMGGLNLPVLEVFVKNGLDVKKKYESKGNADILLLAMGSDKDFAITEYLISKGLSLNETDKTGASAITYAARQGNVNAIKKLVEKGIKPGDKDLLSAAQGPFRGGNKIDVFQYLVDDLKLKPTAVNETGQNVLHIIGAKAGQDEIITYFVKKGVDVNQADKNGNTPFMNVCGGKSVKVVELMLPKVKNINALNTKGESALLHAVKGSTAAVVDLLLANKADITLVDKEGHDLAYYLVNSYRPQGGRGGRGGAAPQEAGAPVQDDFSDKLVVLKSKGLSFNTVQKDGSTLLHVAVAKNDVDLLKKIAPFGIDVNAKNKEGATALHKAVLIARNDKVIQYLVSIGANKDITTSFGETPYDLARENEFLTKNNVSIDFLK